MTIQVVSYPEAVFYEQTVSRLLAVSFVLDIEQDRMHRLTLCDICSDVVDCC